MANQVGAGGIAEPALQCGETLARRPRLHLTYNGRRIRTEHVQIDIGAVAAIPCGPGQRHPLGLDPYPERPDLACHAKEIGLGWFIGCNIANREKKKILRAACEVMW